MTLHSSLSFAAVVLLISPLSSCTSSPSHLPLATAKDVNIQRYTGHWHEQFRLPNRFQKDDATAEADYTLLPDGRVRVVNTEKHSNGTQKTATGIATVVPHSSNSRLRVKFEGLAVLVPASEEGNYWIIKLSPDYSTALVGTPDRKFLWLLSRDQNISAPMLDSYRREARKQGFDTSKLLYRNTISHSNTKHL